MDVKTILIAVLVVVVMVLAVVVGFIYFKKADGEAMAAAESMPQSMQSSGGKDEVAAADEYSYEKKIQKAMDENREYFQVCENKKDNDKFISCECNNDKAPMDYNGKDYMTYIRNEDLTEDIIKHHEQWISDKKALEKKGGAYVTGRAYSPDSHDGYDPIPWLGLRRPEPVPVCNPTQVPDIDVSLYRKNKFCI